MLPGLNAIMGPTGSGKTRLVGAGLPFDTFCSIIGCIVLLFNV